MVVFEEGAGCGAEVFFDFEAVGAAPEVFGGKEGCAASGAGVYYDIAFVGEEPYEKFEHGHAFLCGVYAGCAGVADVVDAVEYHLAVVVEFGQFVAV